MINITAEDASRALLDADDLWSSGDAEFRKLADSIQHTEGFKAMVNSFKVQTGIDVNEVHGFDLPGAEAWLRDATTAALLAGYRLGSGLKT